MSHDMKIIRIVEVRPYVHHEILRSTLPLSAAIPNLMHICSEQQMAIASHSRAAQAAYQDLLRLHLDERASELIGTVEVRERGGRVYLYDKFRIGTSMKTRYLGEGTPELRARLARAEQLKAEAEGRRTTMATVILYRSGVLIQIPRPERFAVHKLIVADRRRGGPDHAEARKDRAQAAHLWADLGGRGEAISRAHAGSPRGIPLPAARRMAWGL
jgi:hypothetical protein